MQETWIRSIAGSGRPTPVFLSGKIPWIKEPGGLRTKMSSTEEPGSLQSMGSQRVRHDVYGK